MNFNFENKSREGFHQPALAKRKPRRRVKLGSVFPSRCLLEAFSSGKAEGWWQHWWHYNLAPGVRTSTTTTILLRKAGNSWLTSQNTHFEKKNCEKILENRESIWFGLTRMVYNIIWLNEWKFILFSFIHNLYCSYAIGTRGFKLMWPKFWCHSDRKSFLSFVYLPKRLYVNSQKMKAKKVWGRSMLFLRGH